MLIRPPIVKHLTQISRPMGPRVGLKSPYPQLYTSLIPPPPIHNQTILKFNDNSFDPKHQQRTVNLGKIIDQLTENLPNILNQSLPKSIISSNIMLRICPSHVNESYLPAIKGHLSYYTTLKTIQILINSFILNPQVKLHIQNIKVIEDSSNFDLLCVYKHSTKIHVRWSTCNEKCYHLNESSSTSDAKLGSNNLSGLDASKLQFQHPNHNPNVVSKLNLIANLSKLSLGLVGLNKNEKSIERVVSGIFIFELNNDNDEIIVHTIDDINIIENESQAVGDLKIC